MSAEQMIADIERHVAETKHETGRRRLDDRVLEAMATVPRDQFVPIVERELAWRDMPLSIGHGQTISQPFIVALMTDLLNAESDSRILEIGSGCGYQAAVLGQFVAAVYGIEIVTELAHRASATLDKLGYDNITIRSGDGYAGWPEQGPFDGIIVAAAGREVPEPLLQQLKVGGRLVLPVEDRGGMQYLRVVERKSDESFSTHTVLSVRFVPLVRFN